MTKQHTQPLCLKRPRIDGSNNKKKEKKEIVCDLFGDLDEADTGVIFVHGFGGNRQHLAPHAEAIVAAAAASSPKKSCCALLPDGVSLTEGGTIREILIDKNVRCAQEANVRQVIEHAKFLTTGGTKKKKKLAFVGHSAGGAIVLEAAVALQKNLEEEGIIDPPVMVVLLDAVPWKETMDLAPQFDVSKTQLVSLRCEPSSWNKQGNIQQFLVGLPKKTGTAEDSSRNRVIDVKILGAKHGDALPPLFVGKLIGVTTSTGFDSIRQLTLAALFDGLGFRRNSSNDDKGDENHNTESQSSVNTDPNRFETVAESLRAKGKLEYLM